MRSKFSWEAGAVAVAAVYGCEIQNESVAISIVLFLWNAKLRHMFINRLSGIHDTPSYLIFEPGSRSGTSCDR